MTRDDATTQTSRGDDDDTVFLRVSIVQRDGETFEEARERTQRELDEQLLRATGEATKGRGIVMDAEQAARAIADGAEVYEIRKPGWRERLRGLLRRVLRRTETGGDPDGD